ncbi:helicase HerA-like domain-containing protein [Enterovibrio sp. 27052020O]|uniref:helicase HerA-like domain-containing protein n=1 Tax=Enterovibrio sp. 27052020O TaxID=3241166 RepID=UPI00388D99AE
MQSKHTFTLGASNETPIVQLGKMSNRHGMIAGATGTGKTVTLQVLAEGFSQLGVPVFAADIKGDLSGIAVPGKPHPKIDARLAKMPLPDYQQQGFPVSFWDLYGENGLPVRTTISDMGPLLLANLLELNDTQEGVLYAAFKIADEQGMLMLDLKDLRAMLVWMGENAKSLSLDYGNISSASIGAIQRRLLVLDEQGGDKFFGEPALELSDMMQVDYSRKGVINLLDATRLYAESPRLYSAFLLWILSELFEQLPEQGDADVPKMVFFFDEAHLLFESASKPLLEKLEQVVRLIRSKGVGVYFISQSPMDIPEDVLGQLGLKIQHALRAFTPKDRKAIKTVAENFRENPALDTASVLTELGIGEALVSVLNEKGTPTVVEHVLIAPPQSRIGPLTADERTQRLSRSPLKAKYDQAIDRHSAYEVLKEKALQQAQSEQKQKEEQQAQAPRSRQSRSRESASSSGMDIASSLAKSAARAMGSQLGRQIIRGIMGSLFGGKKR